MVFFFSILNSAVKELNGADFEGSQLIAELAMESKRGNSRGGGSAGGGSARSQRPGSQTLQFGSSAQGPQRQPDFPLR